MPVCVSQFSVKQCVTLFTVLFFPILIISSLEIHGGTTKHMIETEVERAMMLSRTNKEKFGDKVHTVLFFDEANTTDALGLIKEIMCDRRLNGKHIEEDIKFAAACNPYRM